MASYSVYLSKSYKITFSKLFSVLIFSLIFSKFSIASPIPVVAPDAQHIFGLINDRLSYMEKVALFKNNTHKAVEDLGREKIVLEKTLSTVTDLGLNPESISGFIQAQMDAAKAIQYRYRAQWLSIPPQTQRDIDLQGEVRPRLIELGKEIMVSISQYLKAGGRFQPEQMEEFIDSLKVNNLSTVDKKNIFKSLLKIEKGAGSLK